MDDYQSPADWDEVKHGLAARLREVRMELYGEHGGPMLAEELKIPHRAWVRYENGASMPAQVMLRFLERTGANPHWLLTGAGSRFATRREG